MKKKVEKEEEVEKAEKYRSLTRPMYYQLAGHMNFHLEVT